MIPLPHTFANMGATGATGSGTIKHQLKAIDENFETIISALNFIVRNTNGATGP